MYTGLLSSASQPRLEELLVEEWYTPRMRRPGKGVEWERVGMSICDVPGLPFDSFRGNPAFLGIAALWEAVRECSSISNPRYLIVFWESGKDAFCPNVLTCPQKQLEATPLFQYRLCTGG